MRYVYPACFVWHLVSWKEHYLRNEAGVFDRRPTAQHVMSELMPEIVKAFGGVTAKMQGGLSRMHDPEVITALDHLQGRAGGYLAIEAGYCRSAGKTLIKAGAFDEELGADYH